MRSAQPSGRSRLGAARHMAGLEVSRLGSRAAGVSAPSPDSPLFCGVPRLKPGASTKQHDSMCLFPSQNVAYIGQDLQFG
jgi:hypothetical protein